MGLKREKSFMVKFRDPLQLSFFIIVTAFLLSACSSSKNAIKVDSRWQEDYLHLEEREVPSLEQRRYLPEQQIYYSFSNDSDNLYIMMEMVSKQVTAKMLFAGSTLWINTEGKSKESMGIKFPLAMEGETRDQEGKANQAPGERLKAMMEDKRRLTLIGIRDKESVEINHLEPGAPNAVIWADAKSGHLMYMARIPFHTIGIGEVDTEDKIAIGFETGSLDEPEPQSQIGGMRRTGRRGTPRGRRGGQQGRKYSSEMTQSTEFWFQFNLSAQQGTE